jgi:hypothetical protein
MTPIIQLKASTRMYLDALGICESRRVAPSRRSGSSGCLLDALHADAPEQSAVDKRLV